MIVEQMTDLIGNTPMLKISQEVHGLPNVNLYAKLEMMNPFGSVKDRIAWEMVKDDLDSIIQNKQMVIENSSGNTSKALQAIAGIYDIPFKMAATFSKLQEPYDVLRVQGANIEEITQAGTDCFDPDDLNDPQYVIERMVKQSDGHLFFTSQFTNEKAITVHKRETGPEIMADLDRVDYVFGGLGTTGSTRGIIEAIRERDAHAKCVAVCGSENEMLPGVRNIAQLWEVGIYRKELYDKTMGISPTDSVTAMLELNRKCGLLCGPSAGGQYAAIKQYFTENPATEETNVVFIACDRMEWYLSYIKKYRPDVFDLDAEKHGAYARFYPTQKDIQTCTISPEKLTQWREEHEPLIIDMRTPTSLKILRFDGSMNIPEKTLEEMLEKNQPFDPKQKVLFICAVGMKSLKVAAFLRTKNIEAYSLQDGIVSYQRHKKMA